jgi:nucleotide-binding universal stress UspA family protein
MRILIGYNGSEASTAALNDLRHAGLPSGTIALLVAVAEGRVTPKSIAEAEHLASKGTAILRQNFSDWTIASEASAGIPVAKLLGLADSFRPDLIVIGEPRHSLKNGVLIGNTSHAMLTGARCSVRIARGIANDVPHAERIVVGFDGSPGSTRAVDSITSRSWPEGTDVRLLSVADSSVLEAIGRFKPQMANASVQTKFASQWAQSLAASAKSSLTNAGIRTSVELKLGDAKDVIVAEAENWNADTIFVGPHCSGDSFQRFLLGSVSASVAARAHCSVEVVRC